METKQIYKCLLTLIVISILSTVVLATTSNRIKSLRLIKSLNREGAYIGLVTVYSTEEDAFFASGAFKSHPQHPFVDLSGRRFRIGKIERKDVIYVRCGVGMVNAVAATQQMLDVFNMIGVIHFGIAGNLNNSLSIGDVTVPKQIIHTGIWDWLNPNGTLELSDIAHMDFGEYDVMKGNETNVLGRIGFSYERLYSESGVPNVEEPLVWAPVTASWLNLAHDLKGVKLERCVNSSLCLPEEPKVVVGLNGSTSNIFVDNAAYRDFIFETFQVSSSDMESSAIVMTCLSNGFPVIVIRGLSDIAGKQTGQNLIQWFGSLAASNTVKLVLQFINSLPQNVWANR